LETKEPLDLHCLLHRVAVPKAQWDHQGAVGRRLGRLSPRRYVNVSDPGADRRGWRSGVWSEGRSISIACCTELLCQIAQWIISAVGAARPVSPAALRNV